MFLGEFMGGRLREHPWSMVHPWSMAHGQSMVHGRSMAHGPSSIHGPGRGCHDVEAKRADFCTVFGQFCFVFGCFFGRAWVADCGSIHGQWSMAHQWCMVDPWSMVHLQSPC